MKNLLNYLVWPVLAGLGFAATLLLAPWLTTHIPVLAPFKAATVSSPAKAVAVVSYSEAIKKAAPAVVSINSLSNVASTTFKRTLFLEAWVRETQIGQSNSLGSGVIISPDGYIVTSYHVFFGNDPRTLTKPPQINVTLNDGQELEAQLVQLDTKNDLALIKVNKDNLPFLTLSDRSNLDVGNVVLAIGNPHNIGQSVSSGIVSALWRKDDSFIIQTDAAINPGNSGGALIDVNGDLIGINSTIVSESGGSEGISFAIDAGEAVKLLKGLRDEYTSTGTKSYLGLTTDVAISIELKNSSKMLQGFHVSDVIAKGPADRAGIHAGDLIIAVGNQEIHFSNSKNPAEIQRETVKLTNLPSFQLVMITVFREGSAREAGVKEPDQVLQIPVILGKTPPNLADLGSGKTIQDAAPPPAP
jgi:S1-C subfamily serine protease